MHSLSIALWAALGALCCSADFQAAGPSPSYSHVSGPENVRVKVEQQGNGFAYSIGDPSSGSSSFYNLGSHASPYASSGFGGPSPMAGFFEGPGAGFDSSPYMNSGLDVGSFPSLGQQYAPASAAAPAYQGFSGYSGPAQQEEKEVPGTYQAPQQAPASQSGMGGILPAGFSYHGTDGQSFLRQGGVPDFVISGEGGPAEKSFHGGQDKAFRPSSGSGSGLLSNGLVGYGPAGGSEKGVLPIGGFAKREHGGHTIEDA